MRGATLVVTDSPAYNIPWKARKAEQKVHAPSSADKACEFGWSTGCINTNPKTYFKTGINPYQALNM